MADTRQQSHEWERRMTDAYSVGIEIADTYRHGTRLVTAIGRASIRTGTLDDAYPPKLWAAAVEVTLALCARSGRDVVDTLRVLDARGNR